MKGTIFTIYAYIYTRVKNKLSISDQCPYCSYLKDMYIVYTQVCFPSLLLYQLHCSHSLKQFSFIMSFQGGCFLIKLFARRKHVSDVYSVLLYITTALYDRYVIALKHLRLNEKLKDIYVTFPKVVSFQMIFQSESRFAHMYYVYMYKN